MFMSVASNSSSCWHSRSTDGTAVQPASMSVLVHFCSLRRRSCCASGCFFLVFMNSGVYGGFEGGFNAMGEACPPWEGWGKPSLPPLDCSASQNSVNK